jgi:hypothetical protein
VATHSRTAGMDGRSAVQVQGPDHLGLAGLTAWLSPGASTA